MKRAIFLVCGCCWLLFGLWLGSFLLFGVASGAGSAFPIPGGPMSGGVSSTNIALGLVHVAGLFALSIVCVLVGISLLLHGFIFHQTDQESAEPSNVLQR